MGLGCQINLDLGEGQITYGVIFDDIRMPCTELKITFNCPNKLTFSNDSRCYFIFKDIPWIPTSYKEVKTQNGFWNYTCTCNPKCIFDFITKPTTNTFMLAQTLKLTLTSDSISLPILFPILNKSCGKLIQLYRFQSLETSYNENDIGKSHIIYTDGVNVLSKTLKQIVSQKATEMDKDIGTNIPKFVDDEICANFTAVNEPECFKMNDYLLRILGRKFEIITSLPALFLNMYTMKFDKIPEFDTDAKYLCVRSELDIMNPVGFTHTFAEVKYV